MSPRPTATTTRLVRPGVWRQDPVGGPSPRRTWSGGDTLIGEDEVVDPQRRAQGPAPGRPSAGRARVLFGLVPGVVESAAAEHPGDRRNALVGVHDKVRRVRRPGGARVVG